MHSVELKLAEKNENLFLPFMTCEKLEKKCIMIPELQKETKEMREVVNKINKF